MRYLVFPIVAAMVLSASAGENHAAEPAAETPVPASAERSPESAMVLGYTMNMIDGTPKNLSDYKGKVVMIVNVASRCGYTPQYAALQSVYEERKDKGLVILGFPANNFGAQEPGTNAEIASFCTSKFGVGFPMFEKIDVSGPNQHPLYKQLASQPAPVGGDPKWNFTKFLVDRSGKVVARYEPKSRPDDPALLARIDELLAAKE